MGWVAEEYWFNSRPEKGFTCSPKVWGLLSFLFKGYWGVFPRGKSKSDVKLTTHFNIVSRLRMSGFIALFPTYTDVQPIPNATCYKCSDNLRLGFCWFSQVLRCKGDALKPPSKTFDYSTRVLKRGKDVILRNPTFTVSMAGVHNTFFLRCSGLM
jgi:hypothetical protein